MIQSFEAYLTEGEQWDLTGWDFDAFKDRWVESPTTWSFQEIVENHFEENQHLLDMGTGGGEFLASLKRRPKHVCATEAYPPNIDVAKNKLEPLGINVFAIQDDAKLPFKDNSFEVIINRHESFNANEVYRILKPGGVFITQQVGGKDNQKINELLNAPGNEYANWNLDVASAELKQAGLSVTTSIEEFPKTEFKDIGALVVFLRSIPWQIPDFTVAKYLDELRQLHLTVFSRGMGLDVYSHRFLLVAGK